MHESAYLDERSDRGPRVVRTALRSFALLLLAASAFSALPWNSYAGVRFQTAWTAWLPAIQIVGTAVLAVAARRRMSARDWIEAGLWNAVLAGVVVLSATGRFEPVLFWTVHLLLRTAVGGLWAFAVCGLPAVVYWLWSRNRRADRRRAPAWTPWWFSTLVLLATAEPLALMLEPPDRDDRLQRLSFPEDLPAPPDGEWHLAALGGSTTVGVPYHPTYSFPKVAAWRLERLAASSADLTAEPAREPASEASPSHTPAHRTPPRPRIVVHNCAREGENLRQAISRLHTLKYRPHVILLYSGHNEFYHDVEELLQSREQMFERADRWFTHSPLFRLVNRELLQRGVAGRLISGRGRAFVDEPIARPDLAERRLLRFRRQLEQLAEFCRRNEIGAVWFVPAGSESGFDPNRSTVAPGTSHRQQEELQRLYDEARRLQRSERWGEAAALYRRGLEAQPAFAEFHYRLGQCLEQTEQYGAARRHYGLALEYDGHPVRATSAYRLQVAQVAEQHGIPCIDAGELLRKETPHGILDRTMFHDNVHPTLLGFYLLGTAAAERIAADLSTPFSAETFDEADFAQSLADLGVGSAELAQAYFAAATGLHWLARLRFDQTDRLAWAERYQRWAEQLQANEIQPGEAGTERLER